MSRLIDIVGEAGQTLDEARVARDREQTMADWKFDVKFGRVARAERLASDREARLKPVWREMQKIEPIVPPSRVPRLGSG